MRSWRRQLHVWDNGTPARATTGDGGDQAAGDAHGGNAVDGIDAGEEGELDPIMMEEEEEEAGGGWAGGAAQHDDIEDD